MFKIVLKVRDVECLKLIRKSVVSCSKFSTSVYDKYLNAFLDKNTSACCTRIFNKFYWNYFSLKTNRASEKHLKTTKKRKCIDSELETLSANKRKTSSLSDLNLDFDSDNSLALSDSASNSELNMSGNVNSGIWEAGGDTDGTEDSSAEILKAIGEIKTEMNSKFDALLLNWKYQEFL